MEGKDEKLSELGQIKTLVKPLFLACFFTE
jgi:hypothetical protein